MSAATLPSVSHVGSTPRMTATGIPDDLPHHQIGRGGELVDDGDLGDLELAAEGVGRAPQVEDGHDTGRADGDVGHARGATGDRRCPTR